MSAVVPVPASKASWTILEVLQWTTARFTERGISSPRLDAELLAAHALGLSRVQLYTQFDRPLDAAELAALRMLVKRRQGGEPVAYLTGRKEFWSLDLAVDARVLIPRPDSETAVEEVLARIRDGGRVADVGTGAGTIALALAKARPDLTVFASDVSEDALMVARGNAERLGLAVTFVEGSLLEPLRASAPFDLLVANLPYVPTAEIAGLSAEVRCEPRLALDGGADGLDLVRALVAQAAELLGPDGALVLEIGAGQAAASAELLRAAGFADVRMRRDLGGVERVVSGQRPAQT